MDINSELVEKITRLVLSKLNEYSELNKSSETLPLSDEEIKQWSTISSALYAVTGTHTTVDGASNVSPLTEEELRQWGQITASFSTSTERNNPSLEPNLGTSSQVKFYKTYN